MNYIKELNAFRDWMLLNDLPTGGIALWHTLMSINNMTGWKERFNAPNTTVEKLTGLSKQGLVDARKRLIENGLIEYEKGSKNKAPIYKMISLVKFIDEKLDSSPYQSEYQSTYPSHTDDLTIPKHKQNETKRNEIEQQQPSLSALPEESTEKKKPTVVVDEDFAKLTNFYSENIGMLTPAVSDELNAMCDMINPELVLMALKESVLANAKNKINYTHAILKSWKSQNYKTTFDVIGAEKRGDRSNGANSRRNANHTGQGKPQYADGVNF
ncbi:DnaD domain protein [Mammaliicoccus sciuri]